MTDPTEMPGSLISNRDPSKPASGDADRSDACDGSTTEEQRARQTLHTGQWFSDRLLRVLLAPPALPDDVRQDYFDGVMGQHFDLEALAGIADLSVIQILAALTVLHAGGHTRHEFDNDCTGVHIWLTCQTIGG